MRHLQLLARLHVKRSQYRQAAGVLQTLGLRRSGPGDLSVSLSERLDALSQAVLQVTLISNSDRSLCSDFCGVVVKS